MVKDEADIIATTIEHLLMHTDEIVCADNGSSDATPEILRLIALRDERLTVLHDGEVGYYQSRKMTALADAARVLGHDWVLPCDADEIWHSEETEVPIRLLLDRQPPDVGIVTAELFDHITTGEIPEETVDLPVQRMIWRKRKAGGLPKVAARLLPGLVIEQGNHGAHYPGEVKQVRGLAVRHFPYRSVQQFVSKVQNGAKAYAETDLPWDQGRHWREYGRWYYEGGVEALREIYAAWLHVERPDRDLTLILDPAPLWAGPEPA
jgi:glycosyltransferase involved in cell wall biosynthesis